MRNWLLVLGLSAIYTVSTFGATITDLAATHWAYDAAVYMENKGYMSLNSSGSFLPNSVMNYFEVADVLAKATGYVDVEVNKNVEASFKEQIISNYEKQKPTLAAYASKYSTWDKLYDEQVAYLLGRGYISTTDLEHFVTASSKTTMTKQDLAVWVVRLLGKEATAKNTYKTTGYADESSIAEANRPHVAYLKSLGIISGSGNFAPETKVTRALCAKMIGDALVYKESLQGNTSGSTTQGEEVTIKKVLTKNANEYYVSLVRGGNTSYYTIKNTVQVLDASGKAINISSVPAETKATVTIELQGSTEYITSMKLAGANSSAGTGSTNNNSNNNDSSNSNNTSNNNNTSNSTLTTFTGKLTETSSNGILRITLADGTIKVFILDTNCLTTLNGISASADDIAVGDTVVVTAQGSNALKVIATTGSDTSTSATGGELTKKALTANGYVLTVKSGNADLDFIVPTTAKITRNNKEINIENIRIGDTVAFTKTGNTISEVKATGTRSNVQGSVTGIYISATPTVTLKTTDGIKTYAVAEDAELYDQNSKKYIGLRDIHLGQSLDIILDSKEVVSLDIQAGNSATNYKATIKEIGRGYSYIDVIIDYDPVTGNSQVLKRIYTPVELPITLNGKVQSRSTLKEGMELVITYEYLDDKAPQKILILG